MKFYAIKSGLKTGVFTDWNECGKYVTGVSGAVHKSFKTEAEANAYLGLTSDYCLKDYKSLPKNEVYKFDNLFVFWNGEILLSHYEQEMMWYPFDENDKYFQMWKDRTLSDTGKTIEDFEKEADEKERKDEENEQDPWKK